MTDYIALIRKDADSDYGVEFPDFPGCVTAGVDLDEAKDFAAESLALHLEGMRADGMGAPAPSSLETVMANPRYRDAVAFLVSVPDAKEKAVRVNVTFSAAALHRIDAAARARGMTRSGFLQDAALSVMDD